VKWLDRIVLSDEESDSHWQRQDYKGFSPSATLETSNYSLAQSIQELPVQSAILTPKNGEKALRIDRNGQTGILVKGIFKQHLHEGYAWSGGGRGINRVDVSSDGGKTWIDAKLVQNESNWGKQWAWTKWEAFVPIYNFEDAEIICKAVDSSYQSQPENFGSIYNVRGVLSNAWHRVKIKS
jgi:sulfite oxidase